MRLALSIFAMLVTACQPAITTNSGDGGAPPPGQTSSCTLALSGSVTGTFDCAPAETGWSASNNAGGFTFAISPNAGPAVNVAIGWTGEPTAKLYTNADADATGGMTVTTGSGAATQVWGVNVNGSSTQGTYDLSFTSVTNAVAASTGKVYNCEGTLDATLAPLTGQSGTVTVHVTF